MEDNAVSYGSRPSGLANPNLRWETSDQLDLGVEMRFLRNRLAFSADYFDKKTKDLLVNINPVPELDVYKRQELANPNIIPWSPAPK